MPGNTEVRYVGIFVHFTTDTVTYKLAHHSVAKAFGVRLDGVSQVAEARYARFDTFHTLEKALFGDVYKLLHFRTDNTYRNRTSRVAVPSVEDCADVVADDLSFLQYLAFAGYAVHHFAVDADADACGPAVGRRQ